MRAFRLISIGVIMSLVAIYALKAVTGDPLSAMVLALTLFVTVGALFSGPSAATRRATGRRS